MSRRRSGVKRESVVPGFELPVYCTGRRKHDRHPFGSVKVLEDGRVLTARLKVEHATVVTNHDGTNVDMATIADVNPGLYVKALDRLDPAGGSHETFQFDCPRCGRKVPLTDARLTTVARELVARGAPFFDVSALQAASLSKE